MGLIRGDVRKPGVICLGRAQEPQGREIDSRSADSVPIRYLARQGLRRWSDRPLKALIYNEKVARPERFERPTPRFVVWCSIQLSYGRALAFRRRRGT